MNAIASWRADLKRAEGMYTNIPHNTGVLFISLTFILLLIFENKNNLRLPSLATGISSLLPKLKKN